MLLLIGGAPGVGKSTVAQRVAHELGMLRLVDLDVIRDLLRIQSREQDDPMMFRNALNAWDLHGPMSQPTVVAGFQAHIRPLVGAASRLLDNYLRTSKSAIFHGVPLVPSHFARYRNLGVHLVLLAARNEEEYRARLSERGRLRAGRAPAKDRLDAGWILHQHLVADAAACGVPIISEESEAQSASALLRRIGS
ncbi:MAG: AAA family ATPase [Myxococcales bacterium]|jgi:2-phosphoglycerate kinase